MRITRRQLFALLGSSAIASSRSSHAAERIPVIGVLWHAGNAQEEAAFRNPLREGFAKLGYIEGKNIIFEERYAAEIPEQFDKLAAEFVALNVDILIAGSIPAARAAQRATQTIPIILVGHPNPVEMKLISSLSHPGGNITGLSAITLDLMAKRVQIFKEALPPLMRVALLLDPNPPYDGPGLINEVQIAADAFHIGLHIVEARVPGDLHGAFAKISEHHLTALIVSQNSMYYNERKRISELALNARIATMMPADLFVEAGGLISYGPSWPPIFRNAAIFVDKILKGAKPADLPVEQPTVFEMTVNLKTAQALGVEIPLLLLARADRVIE